MYNLKLVAAGYVEDVQDGTGQSYWGRIDHTPDEEVLTDETNE
jgi:hypothetical protein